MTPEQQSYEQVFNRINGRFSHVTGFWIKESEVGDALFADVSASKLQEAMGRAYPVSLGNSFAKFYIKPSNWRRVVDVFQRFDFANGESIATPQRVVPTSGLSLEETARLAAAFGHRAGISVRNWKVRGEYVGSTCTDTRQIALDVAETIITQNLTFYIEIGLNPRDYIK